MVICPSIHIPEVDIPESWLELPIHVVPSKVIDKVRQALTIPSQKSQSTSFLQ